MIALYSTGLMLYILQGGQVCSAPPPCVPYWIPPVLTLVSSVYLLLAIGFVYIHVPVKAVCTGMAKAFGVE